MSGGTWPFRESPAESTDEVETKRTRYVGGECHQTNPGETSCQNDAAWYSDTQTNALRYTKPVIGCEEGGGFRTENRVRRPIR